MLLNFSRNISPIFLKVSKFNIKLRCLNKGTCCLSRLGRVDLFKEKEKPLVNIQKRHIYLDPTLVCMTSTFLIAIWFHAKLCDVDRKIKLDEKQYFVYMTEENNRLLRKILTEIDPDSLEKMDQDESKNELRDKIKRVKEDILNAN